MPPLPPPLPPETRTVGQLVAETLRLYGRRPWQSLALGIGPALLNGLARQLEEGTALVVLPLAGGVVLSATYLGAAAIATDTRRDRSWLTAFAAGLLVFVPFPFLVAVFVLPGLIWFALLGLAVPAIVVERLGFRAGFARAVDLARADFVHALGSLAALAIVVFLTQATLFFLLRGTGEQTITVASFVASVVVSPVLFLGAALLYFDQAARVESR